MASVENEKACAGHVVRLEPLASTGMAVRRSERRADLRQVIREVVVALLNRGDERNAGERPLPGIFEQALARIIPARHIRLREVPTRYQARLVTPTRTSDALVLDVPTADADRQFVLEAIVDGRRALDEWHVDVMSGAALLGTVVLELENRRIAAPTVRLDGAAPLIGSTPVMRSLRERVERVAGTDFMTLIEGAMRR